MERVFIGDAMLRLEDGALLRGQARYVDDVAADHLRAAFVRTPVAHARILSIDASSARRAPGVVAVYTAADLALGLVRAHRALASAFDRPPLADAVVRFVGEPVAIVVAGSRAAALDAAELVVVDYEPLPTVVDLDEGAATGAPVLCTAHGSNVLTLAARESEHEALAGAEVVVRAEFVNQRVATAPMEPDGALAVPDPRTGGVVVWASTQRVHTVRDALATSLGLDPSAVRVIAPHVGGGFGGKFEPTPETIVVAAAARHLGRPVAWTQTRTENLLTMPHGRGQRQRAALGLRRDGTFTGLWVELTGEAGAYPMVGALIPGASLSMAPGTYRLAHTGGRARSIATNTTPVGAYRGAGRPEACALIERLVDIAARELRIDPLDLRRRNLVPADAFPYETATGMVYDSGDYRGCLDLLAGLVDYDRLRQEQEQRRRRGDTRVLGIGVAMWIDCTPMNRPGEYAAVRVQPRVGEDDHVVVTVHDGANDQGQAHRSTWAMIVADALGVSATDVELVLGDTAVVAQGEGTGSARSLQLAGNAVAAAARQILDQARAIAARLLEAAAADIVVGADGRLAVAGSPSRSVSWGAVARAAPDGLAAEVDFVQPGPTFPSGAHAAVVEVDTETGACALLRFVAVDDCGRVVNPIVVAGQQQGGIAQGIGQALFEEITYDTEGNLRTSSFADYLVPSAAELPAIEVHTRATHSPVNPLGAKGIGQAGAIGSTPAVQNAVVDALAHLGVRHIDTPLSPERVWRAVNAANTAS